MSAQFQFSSPGIAIPGHAPQFNLSNRAATPLGETPPTNHNPPGSPVGPFPILQRTPRSVPPGLKFPPAPFTYEPTGNPPFNPNDWLNDPARVNADNVFVCHSQGCNLLLKALKEACKNK
jgi:hypothetical protein